jgi:hypothetical protein
MNCPVELTRAHAVSERPLFAVPEAGVDVKRRFSTTIVEVLEVVVGELSFEIVDVRQRICA